MEYNRGIFGVLNQDDMEEQPLVLLDGGVERRCGEEYDFINDSRPGYEGFLFQYTLLGEGVYEKNGFRHTVGRGRGFLIQFPEKADTFWNMTGKSRGSFCICIFRETRPCLL